MKVLASRRLPGDAFGELDDVEVIALTELTQARPDVEAVIVANEAVPLDLLPGLRLIANFGVGVDRVDLATCAGRGIAVTTTPGVLEDATADLTFALMLATRRRVAEGDRLVRSGGWPGTNTASLVAEEVTGATLGIVGLGRIGTAVAQRARGFRMRVFYAQRRRLDTDLAEYRDLDEMLARVDILTVHAPLSDQTRGLLDARRLALIPDGACIVNAARGEIIDEAALVAECLSGRLRAGLDVFPHEPYPPAALLGLPNVVLTPHLGSGTRRTRQAMTRIVVDNVLAVAHGRPPLTPVGA
ncbi:MAG: 2-hydroxyacid dehydrogenase [Frankia sp.]